jgi:hypothetical protein
MIDVSSVITWGFILLILLCTVLFAYSGNPLTAVTLGFTLIVICVLTKHAVDLAIINKHLQDYDEMYTFDATQEISVLEQQRALVDSKTAAALKAVV